MPKRFHPKRSSFLFFSDDKSHANRNADLGIRIALI